MYSSTCSNVCTNTSLQTHALGAYEKYVNISWAHLHKCKSHVNSPLHQTETNSMNKQGWQALRSAAMNARI